MAKSLYPKTKKYEPTLVLTNNTGAVVPIQLFNKNNAGANSSFNAKTQYQWNLTGTNYALAFSVSIQVQMAGGVMTTLTIPLGNMSPAGVVAVLNSLNIGIFYLSVVAGQTLVNVWNDKIIYGNLNINGATNTNSWILNGSIQVNNAGVVGLVSLVALDLTHGFFPSNNTFFGITPPENFPFNNNIPFPPTQLAAGDAMELQVRISPVIVVSFVMVLTQNGTTIINNTQSGTFANYNFPYVANAVYNATITIN